ncbi:spermatogenesis-associated protein [Paracoccidioides lutzii Pb01]|uniref:Spermatogenesis-associated protein n=1 Tax=Paracoccidioides lutzii (strain ATCC MYA-826 / Pb01) TaxID=502779 RepID=C1GYA2_PARBA|nr:spermatogenesis-associated protein [Paracoccidioides lutzii Pb01]EEH41493.2 spermatogenesis-associated protein [Paracoccidioides lutzii Pb01]
MASLSERHSSQTEKGAASAGPELVNRLYQSKSPYVLVHMNNPVAWQLWDSEAIALAKKLNRLIFLRCHVMEKESFMSPEIAAILNKSFIPIKLDREERPDIDEVYMNYVQATTGSGGWPLNVFLTPDLEPVFGGSYWPGPHSNALPTLGGEGQITFVDILEKLRDVWHTQQLRCRESAKDITKQLREFAEEGTHSKQSDVETEEDLEIELLEEAYQHFASRYDAVNGGFSEAPKFPTPVNLSFLVHLSRYPSAVADIVGYEECSRAIEIAVKTLIAMSRGGIHDQIGHGFARYSVTADWSLPHFEKMLYDQAQLLDVYVDAFDSAYDPELLGAMYDIATYITSPPMLSPTGGFHSSEDADSRPSPNDTEKREGAFYVWTLKELKQILGQRDADVCARHWGVLADGNVARINDPHDEFINQNVLSIQVTPSKLAKEFGLGEDEVVRIIKRSREKLREYRESKRVRPDLDDKIIVAWNGLAIGALAKCSVVLENLDRDKAYQFRRAAEEAVRFIKHNLFDEQTGQLWRIYRGGVRGDTPGFADDYAYLISGLINLYEATFDDSHLQFAEQLQQYLNKHFLAVAPSTSTSTSTSTNTSMSTNPDQTTTQTATLPPSLGYYTTPSTLFYSPSSSNFSSQTNPNTPTLPPPLLRLKPGTDAATPSPNGVIARNLLRLSALLDAGDVKENNAATATTKSYKRLARETVNAFAVEIMQHPFLFVGMLDAIVGLEMGVRGIVGVIGQDDGDASLSSVMSRGEGEAVAEGTKMEGVDDGVAVAPTPIPSSSLPLSTILSSRELVIQKLRVEAGTAASTAAVAVSVIDVRVGGGGDVDASVEKSQWLRRRNALLRDIRPGKNYLLICEAGTCRVVDV